MVGVEPNGRRGSSGLPRSLLCIETGARRAPKGRRRKAWGFNPRWGPRDSSPVGAADLHLHGLIQAFDPSPLRGSAMGGARSWG